MARKSASRAAFAAVLVVTASYGVAPAHATTATAPAPAHAAATVVTSQSNAIEDGVLRAIWAMNGAPPKELMLEQPGRDVPLVTTPSMTRSLTKFDGQRVRVHGRRIGSRLQVVGTESVGTARAAVAASTTTGPQKVAVILAAIGPVPAHPTPDEERAVIFTAATSTNAFYKEISAGKVSLVGAVRADGDVFGWVQVDKPAAPNGACSAGLLAQRARAAAAASGYVQSRYRTTVIVSTGDCSVGGLALLSGDTAWVRPNDARTAVHELGHNFGFMHSAAYSCNDASGQPVALGPYCSSLEYADGFDPMGNGMHHFHAWRALELGVLPPANVKTITANGTYTLKSSEVPASSGTIQLLRIPRKRDANGNATQWDFIELRQPNGTFDNFAPTDPVVNGVTLYIAPFVQPGNGGGSDLQLLDATPSTSTNADAALMPGASITDNDVGVTITTKTVAKGKATITATFFTPPRPKVSVAGGTLTYSAPAGEFNVVTFTQTGATQVDVHDEMHVVALGTGCVRRNDSDARCTGVSRVDADGGDLGDSLRMIGNIGATLHGGSGDDFLVGGNGNDVLDGGPDDDTFDGLSTAPDGADTIIGGGGLDEMSYASRTHHVQVTLGDGLANDGEPGEGDNLVGITRVTGGSGDDTLVGGPGDDVLSGGPGNDTLTGGLGADELSGDPVTGNEIDTVSYADRGPGHGVTVTRDGQANDGEPGEHDNVLEGITRIVGGAGDDDLSTSTDGIFPVTLDGGPGNDTLRDPEFGGALFGPDHFIGGAGFDAVDYSARTTSIVATIGGTGGDATLGEADAIDNDVEKLRGGSGDDVLTGNADANTIEGGPGADVLNGGGGGDTVDYSDHVQPVNVSFDGVRNDGGDEDGVTRDLLTNFSNITGGWGSDTLAGDANTNVLDGGPGGADDIHGGGNIDLVTYATRSDDISVSLDDVNNDGASGEGDNVHSDIEWVLGSNGYNRLVGSSGANVLVGGDAGNDITGGAGTDILIGGNGADTFHAADGEVDKVQCRGGYDHVDADFNAVGARDAIASDCEDFHLPGWGNLADTPGLFNGGGDATSWGGGRIDTAYWKNDATGVYHRWFTCIGLSCGWNEENLGGVTDADPAIATRGVNSLDVVVRGGGEHLYWKSASNAGWSAWTDISNDGRTTFAAMSAPALAAFGPTAFAVFARGTDGALWTRVWSNGQWTYWFSAGGALSGGVGAARLGPGQIAVVGVGTDHRLYENVLGCALGCGFTGWTDLGGLYTNCNCFDGDPALSAQADGTLDLVVSDTQSRALWWKPFRGGVWLAGTQYLGAQVAVNPAIASPAPGQLYVFDARGNDLNWSELRYQQPGA